MSSFVMDWRVLSIDKWALYDCTSLEGITIPYTIHCSVIDKYAFRSCTQLRIVELCDGLERIHLGAFDGCTSLERIGKPSSISYICRGLVVGSG
jgi:hypothetical protein